MSLIFGFTLEVVIGSLKLAFMLARWSLVKFFFKSSLLTRDEWSRAFSSHFEVMDSFIGSIYTCSEPSLSKSSDLEHYNVLWHHRKLRCEGCHRKHLCFVSHLPSTLTLKTNIEILWYHRNCEKLCAFNMHAFRKSQAARCCFIIQSIPALTPKCSDLERLNCLWHGIHERITDRS